MSIAAQKAVAYFMSLGWTRAQAAGIAANLQVESGFRPDAVGDGGEAYGIAQWHPDRQLNFTVSMRRPIRGSSLEDQLAFVHAELVSSEKAAGDVLRHCVTAAEAGACVSKLYERPADREGEAAKRAALAEQIAGEQSAAPIEDQSVPYQPAAGSAAPQENSMGALAALQIFGPMLQTLIPQIAGFLKSDNAKRNVGIAEAIVNTITTTTNTPNLQAAVEAMHDNKEVQQAVQKAVVTEPTIMAALQIVEVGGGAAGARENDLKQQIMSEPFWKNSAVFWISAMLLPLVFWYVGSSVVGGSAFKLITMANGYGITIPVWVIWSLAIFGDVWDAGARIGMANLVVGLVLGGICGVYYGVSVTQAKQQAQQAQASKE